jgi:hypothetical protein
MFLLLLTIVSPSRGITKSRIVDNVQIPEIFDAIRSMLAPAIIVSVFFPMRPGIALGLIGFKMYLVDFVFFWIKLMLVQLILIPFAGKVFRGTSGKWREKLESLPEIIIGALGMIFFLFDLYI